MTHDLPWKIGKYSNVLWKGFGGWGVQLFFVISGVLICWRLLEEEQRTGRILLQSFYIRRLFRIQPAAFFYLSAVTFLFFSGVIRANWGYLAAAGLSYINFVVTERTPPGAAAFLGHFWTLAVEEHFYILLSLFLFLFRERRILLLSSILVTLLAGQTHGMTHGEYSPILSPRRTYWIIQFLLVPALIALVARVQKVQPLLARYFKPWLASLITVLMMLGNQWSENPKIFREGWGAFSPIMFLIVNRDLMFYGFALIVISIVSSPRSLATRFLELPALRFFGRLSYSIYLWHILFFIPIYLGDMVHSRVLLTLTERPWKYIATAITVLLSYYLVEKPFIRVGHRLTARSKVKSPDFASKASLV